MATQKKRKLRLVKRHMRKLRRHVADQVNNLIFPFKPNKGQVVNTMEIRFAGLQRSGNHAIINWIFSQAREIKCYLNNIVVNRNPFIEFQRKGTIREFQTDFYDRFNLPMEQFGFFSRKETLIYSYEEEFLELAFSKEFERHHDRWLGKSARRYDVLLVRDPFNLFASRLKKEDDINANRYSLRKPDERDTLIRLWKQYAREYLGETNFLTNNRVVINYNDWFQDSEYRRKLAETFDLKFSDESMDEVLPIGGGSSFDRVAKDNDGRQMKVLERWKLFTDDPDFQAAFADKELIELSNRIFGEIPGTKEWLNS